MSDPKGQQQNKGVVTKIGKGLAATGGAVAATGGALTAAGFSSSGIVAGSIAAGVQSGIGSVAAGSTFAVLQSMGAAGILATGGLIGLGVLAVGGAVLLIKKITQNNQLKGQQAQEMAINFQQQERPNSNEEEAMEEQWDPNYNLEGKDIRRQEQMQGGYMRRSEYKEEEINRQEINRREYLDEDMNRQVNRREHILKEVNYQKEERDQKTKEEDDNQHMQQEGEIYIQEQEQMIEVRDNNFVRDNNDLP